MPAELFFPYSHSSLLSNKCIKKIPFLKAGPFSKQSSERQAMLGSQEIKENILTRNLGWMERPVEDLARKLNGALKEKEQPVTLFRNGALQKPQQVTLNVSMRSSQENLLSAMRQNKIEKIVGSPLEERKNGYIPRYPFTIENLKEATSLCQKEVHGKEAVPRNVALPLSSLIEKEGKSGPITSLPRSTGSQDVSVVKPVGGFHIESSLSARKKTNPPLLKSESPLSETLPSLLQAKITDREQAIKPIDLQLEAPMHTSSLHQMQSERIAALTDQDRSSRETPIVEPRQAEDVLRSLPISKEAAVLTRSQASSDSHPLFKDNKRAEEIGNVPARGTQIDSPLLKRPKEAVSLLQPRLSTLSETIPIETSSPSFAVIDRQANEAFSPAAGCMVATLANIELPSVKSASRIIASSKTIQEPAIARFEGLPTVLSHIPKIAQTELPPMSEKLSLNETPELLQEEQKPEFTVKVYSQPIIIDNYCGVGRL